VIIKLQLSALARDINKNAQPLAIALGMLARAYQYSQDVGVDRWEFAIPISEFRYAGVTISELKWLLIRGLVVHAREIIQGNGQYCKYIRLGIRSFPADACFVLSDHGVESLEGSIQSSMVPKTILMDSASHGVRQNSSCLKIAANVGSIPQWNPKKRELTFQGEIVKYFRTAAPNQEKFLVAYQEEGWVHRIDDPLPPGSEQDSRERLRSAIKQLNRNQDNNLLRFCGDGSGRGILWQSLV
jgi:hypothetical protein